MKPVDNAFIRILRDRLSEYGAVSEFSRKSGFSRTTVDNWLSGKASPTVESLAAIAAALELEPWELLKPPGEDPQLEELIRVFRRLDKRERAHAVALLKALGGSDLEDDALDSPAKASGPGKQ